MSADALVNTSVEETVRALHPDLDPNTGPGAARRWRRLVRLAEVAQEYRAAQDRGDKAPTQTIADARHVAPGTVRTWLHQAKQEGFDVPRRMRARGGTSLIVRTNIRTLREQRRMTYVDLSARLDEVGQQIPVLGLRRLEVGERRVDVDELVAFAQVFGLAPEQLLEPLPECATCNGAPPPGFNCGTCGTGAARVREEGPA